MAENFDPSDLNYPDSDLVGAKVPAPNEEEPASLRQDILDELSDHLLCAQQREQFRNGDADAASVWQRVLDKFGSPATVARQLWLNWMWEKLLMQRLSLGLATLALICCLAMLAFVWQSSQASQQMLHAAQKAITESQESQQAVLLQLTELANRSTTQSQQPSEWNQLTVRLVYDDEKHSPVVGAKVKAFGISENNIHVKDLDGLTTDGNGEVDFDWMLYGTYRLPIELPNQLKSDLQEVTMRAGQPVHHEIVCPKAIERTQSFDVQIPKLVDGVQFTTDHNVWFRIACQRYEGSPSGTVNNLSTPFGSDWYLDKPYQDYVLWVSPTGVYKGDLEQIDITYELNRFREWTDPEAVSLSRFPCDVFAVPNVTLPSSFTLPYGNYGTSQVSLFLEKQTDSGKACLVGVPHLPLLGARGVVAGPQDLPKALDLLLHNPNEFQDNSHGASGWGASFLGGHQAYQPFYVYDRYAKHNLSLGQAGLEKLEDHEPVQLTASIAETCLFWLAQQLPEQSHLVYAEESVTSPAEVRHAMEPISFQVKSPSPKPIDPTNTMAGGIFGGTCMLTGNVGQSKRRVIIAIPGNDPIQEKIVDHINLMNQVASLVVEISSPSDSRKSTENESPE